MNVTPQQEVSKTLNSSKLPFKKLNDYFWGNNGYFWGNKVCFGGNKAYSRGFSKMLGLLEFLFLLLGGFWDSVGRGGPVWGFKKG